MPHLPDVKVNAIKPDACFVFTSHVQPLALKFNATDGSEVATVFKFGDDVRQDQMVLQLFGIMDKLLKDSKNG
jgi:phosphatidylinositol 3-kinase